MLIEEYMMADPSRAESVKQRLAEKTAINTKTGCLEWTAKSRANGGYGTLCVGREGTFARIGPRGCWPAGRSPGGYMSAIDATTRCAATLTICSSERPAKT